MKTFKWIFILLMLPVYTLFGQLNKPHNHPRAGDVLIKQQVEFKEPGESGSNIIWDFSKLKTINDEYTLSYSQPPLVGDSVYIIGNKTFRKDKTRDDDLIAGTEHNTMYYYRLANDSLLQLGHENPSVRLTYLQPMVHMQYPLNYGQKVTSPYSSEGLYSATVGIKTYGEVITTADAYGKLILPSGDTLNPVLRVKTIQTIFDKSKNNDLGNRLETCKWYTKGYRYPVFETVRNINLIDNSEIFKTAFYYPPQEHLYLDTDTENLALLEEMWDMEKADQDNKRQQAEGDKIIEISDIMLCKAYPNPVESILNIEYELKEDAQVSFQLYSIEGNLVKSVPKKNRKAGVYNEWMDCANLHPRTYILRVSANNLSINQTIIKK